MKGLWAEYKYMNQAGIQKKTMVSPRFLLLYAIEKKQTVLSTNGRAKAVI